MTTLTAVESATSIEDPQILHGDCLEVIQSGRVKAESVSLIFTSPPYADQRKNNYGGIHPDEYVQWFLPRAEYVLGLLRPNARETVKMNPAEAETDCRGEASRERRVGRRVLRA